LSNYYKPSGFGGFSFFPPVIKNLLIINGVVFLIQVFGEQISTGTGYTFSQIITKYFALIPVEGFLAGSYGNQPIIWSFYPWQLITYQFLHGGFSHIFFNMFALWMFGMEIENMWGSKKFLYFYLLCGVVAGICHMFISPLFSDIAAPTLGASGAIFGVMTAFALLFPNRYIFLYFFIPIKAKYLITFLIVLEVMLVDSAHSTIAHLAHLGGALAAFIYVIMDPHSQSEIKYIFKKSSYQTSKPFNPLGGFKERFKKKESGNSRIEEAKYYEIKDETNTKISQEEIDKILDKISRSGYQNLSEKEKKILFEASKKMK